jgi:peptidoglycan/xylan/chitin deacetylase (PgdA/CDA1 family)
LTTVSESDAEEEIVGSKKAIEDALGCPVATFAYPYGAFHDSVRQLAMSHFTLACSTTLGFVDSSSDVFVLERLDMYYFQRVSLMRHLFSPAVGGYVRTRRIMRGLRDRLRSLGTA